jgi:hypothetical protein
VTSRSESSALAAQLEERLMATKKNVKKRPDELRPEYDLAALGKGIRGKYHKRATAGTNLVLLDPDVARAFPTSESVNSALRKLVEIATGSARGR